MESTPHIAVADDHRDIRDLVGKCSTDRQRWSALDKGGRRNTMQEKNVIVLRENAVVVAGFYDFARKEQDYEPRPSRFTFVVVKRDGKWVIAHHHSSPRAAQRQ
jgi:hypothetical protein